MSDMIENNALNPHQPKNSTNWGLIPDFKNDEDFNLKKVLHHFFVEFNPLYLISALCVFYGVFLVANNLQIIDQNSSLSGQTILFFVVQGYEAMIIAGIAFLVFKAHAIRPCLLYTSPSPRDS